MTTLQVDYTDVSVIPGQSQAPRDGVTAEILRLQRQCSALEEELWWLEQAVEWYGETEEQQGKPPLLELTRSTTGVTVADLKAGLSTWADPEYPMHALYAQASASDILGGERSTYDAYTMSFEEDWAPNIFPQQTWRQAYPYHLTTIRRGSQAHRRSPSP